MSDSRKAYLVEITPGRFYRCTDTLGRMQTSDRLADARLFNSPRDACRVSLIAETKGKPARARALTV